MRVAVGLPSLAPGAPRRQTIDAMLGHMCTSGHDVEAFTEHDRTEETHPFRVFHYLRLRERHRARPFDVALYPFGRDGTPFQGVYTLMNDMPGAVWLLDPALHHFAVGGIALLEDWAGYRELIDSAYGAEGAAVAQTVALNWGTGALYRRYDLLAEILGPHLRVLAAWPALAAKVEARLPEATVDVVPLGLELYTATDATVAPFDPDNVAIVTVNESYATTAVRAAAEVLRSRPGARVRLALSEPIYKAEGAKVARHLGIEDRIEWQLTTAPEDLARIAGESSVLGWFAEELQGGHRMLLLRELSRGKLTFVPRCPLYDDLPSGAVVKLALGTSLGPVFAATIDALAGDPQLLAALQAEAVSFAGAQPSVATAAETLCRSLEEVAALGPATIVDTSSGAWSRAEAQILAAVTPGGTSTELEQVIHEIVTDPPEGS